MDSGIDGRTFGVTNFVRLRAFLCQGVSNTWCGSHIRLYMDIDPTNTRFEPFFFPVVLQWTSVLYSWVLACTPVFGEKQQKREVYYFETLCQIWAACDHAKVDCLSNPLTRTPPLPSLFFPFLFSFMNSPWKGEGAETHQADAVRYWPGSPQWKLSLAMHTTYNVQSHVHVQSRRSLPRPPSMQVSPCRCD